MTDNYIRLIFKVKAIEKCQHCQLCVITGKSIVLCVSDDDRSLVDIKRRALENAMAALKEMAHAQENATAGRRGTRITMVSHYLFSCLH